MASSLHLWGEFFLLMLYTPLTLLMSCLQDRKAWGDCWLPTPCFSTPWSICPAGCRAGDFFSLPLFVPLYSRFYRWSQDRRSAHFPLLVPLHPRLLVLLVWRQSAGSSLLFFCSQDCCNTGLRVEYCRIHTPFTSASKTVCPQHILIPLLVFFLCYLISLFFYM